MRFTIQTKLFAGFGLVLAILAIAITVGVNSTGDVSANARQTFAEDAIPLKAAAQDLLTQMVNQETGVRGYLVTGDKSSLEPYEAGRKAVREDLKKMEPLLVAHPIMADLVEEAKPRIEALEDYFESQIALVAQGPEGQAKAQARIGEGKEAFDAFRESATAIEADTLKFVRDAVAEQQSAYTAARTQLIVLGLVGGLLAMGVAWWITRLIVGPVRQLTKAADGIAEGDVNQSVTVSQPRRARRHRRRASGA